MLSGISGGISRAIPEESCEAVTETHLCETLDELLKNLFRI